MGRISGYEQVVRILLDAGADVNDRGRFVHSQALQVASTCAHEREVIMALDRGSSESLNMSSTTNKST